MRGSFTEPQQKLLSNQSVSLPWRARQQEGKQHHFFHSNTIPPTLCILFVKNCCFLTPTFFHFIGTPQWTTSGPKISSNGLPEDKQWSFHWQTKKSQEMRRHQCVTTFSVATPEVKMSQFHHTGCDFDFDLDINFHSDIESDVHCNFRFLSENAVTQKKH